MSLVPLANTKLYHGTSKKRFDSILANGFDLGTPQYNNYLSPNGIYLVLGRPLIARRFAYNASEEDGSTPVVISLKITLPNDDKIWDLTSDDGMHLLYTGYTEIESIWKRHKRQENTRTPLSYARSKKNAIEEIEDWLKEMLQNDLKKFQGNRDSIVIRYITESCKIELVLAAIQEGTSFNYTFSSEEPQYCRSANYHGLRWRDHIEVCVLDPGLIISKSLKIRDKQKDDRFFENNMFGHVILDSRTPDAST